MRDCWKLELALALVAGTWAVLLPATAGAQGYLPDRTSREGPGFKAGRLVLHPGLSLEGGYDSNVFLENNVPLTNPDVDVAESFILRLTGYLDVATESPQRQREGDASRAEPQKITFRGGLGAIYYHWFLDRVPDNVGADAHVDFAYNPSAVFSLQVRDVFRRTVRPFSNPNTLTGETISYGQNHNAASLDLVGRSKSKVLEGRVGYANTVQFFDADIYNYANYMTHHVPGRFSWAFFPTSALVYDFEYTHQQYLNPEAILASPTLLSDNNRVSNLIGYSGAITERFSLTAMIGYAAGFYEIGQSFDDVVARVDGRWRPRPTVTLVAGYDRDVRPSYIGNFTVMNRLYANTRFMLGGALELGLSTWVSFDESGLALSPPPPPPYELLGTQPTRKDTRVYAGIFGEYRFKAWLALFGEIGYLADITDFEYVGLGPLPDPQASYQRFEAWLGLRVFY